MKQPRFPFITIYLTLSLVVCFAFLPLLWVDFLTGAQKLAGLFLCLGGVYVVSRQALKRVSNVLTALKIGLLNIKDGDYASQLVVEHDDSLGELCQLYNDATGKLREEKRWLHQRELMLDKVLQNSPEILLLVNDKQQVVFSNYAARELFAGRAGLEGLPLDTLLENVPATFKDIFIAGREGLFTLNRNSGETETWHLSVGTFNLNNQHHRLFILKQMTRELSRQEVAVWKKVIRIISHELNNSIGPISSMLHSGKLLSQHANEPRLERVFSTISERIAHLTEFVQGYGKFAKLPAPVPESIDLVRFITQLQQQWPFNYEQEGEGVLIADKTQLEQLLINLLKNAYESGSTSDEIGIVITLHRNESVIEVIDRGKGMSENVLSHALIPFYSTKASGSGLGLALCREIAEAHNGRLALYNREGGGLLIKVVLPASMPVVGEP